jgi:hypothetical protein
MKVYVVLAEYGDRDDPNMRVAGVFETKEAAEAAMQERLTRLKAHDEWRGRYVDHLEDLRRQAVGGIWDQISAEAIEGRHQEARRLAGPEPPNELLKFAEIVEVTVGEWIGDGA